MKKFISSAIVLTSLAFVSCRKETTPGPVINPAPHSINVEYRAYDESGHINLQYTLPTASGSTTTQMQVDRTTYSYAFTWTSGQTLSVKASNVNPSGKEVSVEIYVNGQLFKSGQADAPNASAAASGIYQ
ncbi:MAG TPA: hypothetical protein VFJ43_03660 [Bacteroidia bacterium]|nr:hypothetical protein [Bacteroidia bacterium]